MIDQIVVYDNGSTDNAVGVARECGVHVVSQNVSAYGTACLTAIDHLSACDIVLFVDGDCSCDISQAMTLLEGMSCRDDVVIGSRVLGCQEKGALTNPQRFGNWLSSKLICMFCAYELTDLRPFRAIARKALYQIGMTDKTFGWTVEMQVKAIILKMTMSQYPVDSQLRIGESKISGIFKGSVQAGVGILSMIFKLKCLYSPEITQSYVDIHRHG